MAMRRRKYLRMMGVGMIAASIAGCSEEDVDEAEGSVDAEDSDDGNSDSGSNDDGDDSSSSDLEIVDHGFFEEDYQAGVRGTIANNTGEALDYVEVRAIFLDDSGTQLESSIDNTQDLAEGREWAFEVLMLESEPAEVADYEIEVSDSPF